MPEKIRLGEIEAEVTFKDIKNVHMSVHPPAGAVRISAPHRMSLDTVRVFAISRIDWIKAQQKKFKEQERESPRDYLERESHYVWGKRYLLHIIEKNEAPQVFTSHRKLILQTRPGYDRNQRAALLDNWYRKQLKQSAAALVEKWRSIIGVMPQKIFVQQMKTKWGGCNPAKANLRLNTDLAKKPPSCLEYIVVHEMVHLVEPTHNARFISLMDLYLPQWRSSRDELNRLPLRHDDWMY